MEEDSSRGPFGSEMAVLIFTRRNTTVKKLAMTDLQCILTILFIKVDIFAFVVLY